MDRDAMDTTASRADMYSFLAAMFLQEPNEQTLPDQIRVLQLAAYYPPISLTALVENIRQEYFDCFFVPMSATYTPPFESALAEYSGQGRFGPLAGPQARAAAALYEATGFDPLALLLFAPLKELAMPDHIGFELAFMAYLCLQENCSEERGETSNVKIWQEWQMNFLTGHLNCWLPQLATALATREARFYAVASALTAAWVEADFRELAASIKGEV